MLMNSEQTLAPTATRRFPIPESRVVRSAFAHDPDFMELIEFFVGALPERRQAVVDAFERGVHDALRVTAHQLKGAGGGYGFDDLSYLASQLEEACKAADATAIQVRVRDLLDHIDRIRV